MRKLQLSIDDLLVESFEARSAEEGAGTVLGRAFAEAESRRQTCVAWLTCGGERTCNLVDECYTWDGGPTCLEADECNPTGHCEN